MLRARDFSSLASSFSSLAKKGKNCHQSTRLMIFLISVSASALVLSAFLPSGVLGGPSWNFSMICRSRALVMSVVVFSFFFAGPSSLVSAPENILT